MPKHELLHVAESVAREKGIRLEEVIDAMEHALQKAARSKYGLESDIRASIDQSTGNILINRARIVVACETSNPLEISLAEAKRLNPEIKTGEEILEPLPPIEFGRVSAQSARQVIFQKVRDAERARQYEEFKNRKGEMISALVKKIEFNDVIFDVGRADAILKKENSIPREVFQVGDRVRVSIADLVPESKGPLIQLSRINKEFMARLFEQEVPEIYDGVIQIKSIARDPGSRAKIAVFASDPSIDPVGACVGMRGSRVQAVTSELQGEKIDVILWSENPAVFVVNALVPAEVSRVLIDEENKRIDVVVPEEQLSMAIGRRGQNVRLATQLTGWGIDVITEEDDIKRRNEEKSKQLALFSEALDVEEIIAQLLVAEGFSSIEEITAVTEEDLASIEGFDKEIAIELKNRASVYLKKQKDSIIEKCKLNNMEEDFFKIKEFSPKLLERLCENNIKNFKDLSELSNIELIDLLGKNSITKESANEIVMMARSRSNLFDS